MSKAVKRKKTHAPQADPQDVEAILEGLKRLPSPQSPFDFKERGKRAEAAKQLYETAERLHRSFPWNDDARRAYDLARERYQAAILDAYPPNFTETLKRLRQNDSSALKDVIAFLEADPMFYATGYLKEDLARWIKPEMLTPQDASRLRRVVLSIVDRRNHRDFRAFCRLARKVDAPELRDALTHRVTHGTFDVRRRARWVLEALEQPR